MTLNPRGPAAAVALLLLTAGCGSGTSGTGEGPGRAVVSSPSPVASGSPSGTKRERAEATWSTPATGDEAVEVFARMPARLGTWPRLGGHRGTAYYRHPGGSLGVEGGEIRDIYAEPLEAAEAIRRIAQDMRPGHEDCSVPPFRCVQGTFDGEPQMVWSEDGSEVVVVATWPDDEAKELLRQAWQTASGDPG